MRAHKRQRFQPPKFICNRMKKVKRNEKHSGEKPMKKIKEDKRKGMQNIAIISESDEFHTRFGILHFLQNKSKLQAQKITHTQ